jgi:hypothetical protein
MSDPAPSEIALFYDGYEMKALEGVFGAAYSHGRRALRYAYRTLRRRQPHTGFYTAFRGLVASLKSKGIKVRVNDFAYARAHPNEPIGIAGYPSVLERVDLPNPIIFGPGDYGSGEAAVKLAGDPKVKILTQPGAWAVEFNRQWVGDKGAVYFAGIDTDSWPDLSSHVKTIDFLVYDKIRWYRSERTETILSKCLKHLDDRGLSYTVLRYGDHHIDQFKGALAKSRAMLFLCEHETQGLAYQEALSSGVPVLAWDEEILVDPQSAPLAPAGLKVSSVPYFDARCGLRFKMATFPETLDAFQTRRADFDPRGYVVDELSLTQSANVYLALYDSARASR